MVTKAKRPGQIFSRGTHRTISGLSILMMEHMPQRRVIGEQRYRLHCFARDSPFLAWFYLIAPRTMRATCSGGQKDWDRYVAMAWKSDGNGQRLQVPK